MPVFISSMMFWMVSSSLHMFKVLIQRTRRFFWKADTFTVVKDCYPVVFYTL